MKYILSILISIFAFGCSNSISSQTTINHKIAVSLNPTNQSINVISELDIPVDIEKTQFRVFKLHKNLHITNSNAKIEKIPQKDSSTIYNTYKIIPNKKKTLSSLTLNYEGKIYHTPDGGVAEYARGFSQTPGIISEDGIYLSASSYWIPSFDDEMVTFHLEITLPAQWDAVSQGEQTKTESKIVYHCQTPQEEIYLIAAKFHLFQNNKGRVLLQAYLRTDDKELAGRYLGATEKYLAMYEQMLGEYPYSKFALVENFWETGYGMPSFTLLGQKVIRFPFILNSSYPHELLHNYWGNSVYVDYNSGNWCEGITAYMADHLLKEQEGSGAEYRRSTLQKYADYVNAENDFPLSQFISRNNSAQEAIGYGKSLMMNHMLRMKVGNEVFLDNYRQFYNQFIYKRATYNDIAQIFKANANWDVDHFFNQWVNETGAPELIVIDINRQKIGTQWQLNFQLIQKQENQTFKFEIPVAIYYADTVEKRIMEITEKEQGFTLTSLKKPLRLEIDPEYDVFRKLDRLELPSSISQLMGSQKLTIILPQSDPLLEAYKTMANNWVEAGKAQGFVVEIVMDNKITQLPVDQSVWIVGANNKHKENMIKIEALANQMTTEEYQKIVTANKEGSLVITAIPQSNPNISYGFISCNNTEAITGLTRLLPHYGKYSILAFEGNRPTNTVKLILKPNASPLHYQFSDAQNELNPKVKLIPKQPLVR